MEDIKKRALPYGVPVLILAFQEQEGLFFWNLLARP